MRHKLISIKRLNVVCFNNGYQNWAITILVPSIHTEKPQRYLSDKNFKKFIISILIVHSPSHSFSISVMPLTS